MTTPGILIVFSNQPYIGQIIFSNVFFIQDFQRPLVMNGMTGWKLNSKTEIKSYDILYGPNQGHISAVSYGKVLIVEGYVTAQNTGIQYVLAKINDINAINVTQIIFQVGSMPTDPYCMFGSIELDGQITIGSSTQNTLYRFSATVLIK